MAVTVVVLDPAGTVVGDGTPTAALLLVSVTAKPLPTAALVRVMVQELVPPGFTVVGVQASEDSAGGATRVIEA